MWLEIAVAVTAALLGRACIAPVTRLPRFRAANYLGERIPAAYGVSFWASLVFWVAGLALVRSRLLHAVFPVGLAATVAGLAGLSDDLWGDLSVRGFRGHFGAVLRGRVTTGIVKMLGVGAACLGLGLVTRGLPFRGVVDGLAMALGANALNLLDTRPGRALKGFWLLLAAAAILALVSHQRVDATRFAAIGPAILCSLLWARADLGANAMMGDTGSNVLGMLATYALIGQGPLWLSVVAFLLLLGLNAVSEVVSLSLVIERYSIMRWFDGLWLKESRH